VLRLGSLLSRMDDVRGAGLLLVNDGMLTPQSLTASDVIGEKRRDA